MNKLLSLGLIVSTVFCCVSTSNEAFKKKSFAEIMAERKAKEQASDSESTLSPEAKEKALKKARARQEERAASLKHHYVPTVKITELEKRINEWLKKHPIEKGNEVDESGITKTGRFKADLISIYNDYCEEYKICQGERSVWIEKSDGVYEQHVMNRNVDERMVSPEELQIDDLVTMREILNISESQYKNYSFRSKNPEIQNARDEINKTVKDAWEIQKYSKISPSASQQVMLDSSDTINNTRKKLKSLKSKKSPSAVSEENVIESKESPSTVSEENVIESKRDEVVQQANERLKAHAG